MNLRKILPAIFAVAVTAFAIAPNENVSHLKEGFLNYGPVSAGTDGSMTESVFGNEFAIRIGEGPEKLFVVWTSQTATYANFAANCPLNGRGLENFKILVSKNSTNGFDGDWDEALEVKNNPVMARGVEIDFVGYSWLKISSESETGGIAEIEAFDITKGKSDTWFFMGTSISQMGLKQLAVDSTFPEFIHARYPDFYPAMIRGGVGCINSTEVVAHLPEYLTYAKNVNYWAIEMGTNDAWGGGDWNIETYKRNMQTIIDSAKANGIEPILAKPPATNPEKTDGNWQVNPQFLKAIEELTEKNNLIVGPDFYTYFEAHPEELSSDGVHPNEKGAQSLHRLWSEALSALYENYSKDSVNLNPSTPPEKSHSIVKFAPKITLHENHLNINNAKQSRAMLFNSLGQIVKDFRVPAADFSIELKGLSGFYILTLKQDQSLFIFKIHFR